MGALLSEEWGGRRASAAVAETLAQARALAARGRRTTVGPDHLLGALLGTARDPATHAGVVLRAHGDDSAELDRGRPERPGPPPGADRRPMSPPRPGADLAEVLEDLAAWTAVTGDVRTSTLHLLAALARSATEEGAYLRRSGLTPDVVLATGARCRADAHAEDAAFARGGTREADTVLSVPDAPRRGDLRTRTGSRRSPTIARLMSTQLPRGGRLNTRLGHTVLRRWALIQGLYYLFALSSGLLLLGQGIEKGAWALALCVPLVGMELSKLPWSVWLAAKALLLWLAPWPLRGFVLGAVVLELVVIRYELWMKRVDLGDPELPVSHFWRAYWRQTQETVWNRMRTRFEN
ncbi:hypothetical protein ACN6K4_001898 [Streptomyces hayashii]|uniref:hypothetical protein n=1 Tax=Streptomyces hayashii TaxID=2839966 RepID=UPI00403CA317